MNDVRDARDDVIELAKRLVFAAFPAQKGLVWLGLLTAAPHEPWSAFRYWLVTVEVLARPVLR